MTYKKAFKKFIALSLVIVFFSSPCYGINLSPDKNSPAPYIFSLKNIQSEEVITEKITTESIIHLPPSVKEVWIERYEPDPKFIEDAINDYKIKQLIYWPIAALIIAWCATH
ncbi:hypothetical protein ACFLZV_02020 [Candidatus Margulisiibacteriota bacterium]